MTNDTVEAVAALLVEAEAAHGVYETTELNGVYDQAWPTWYAGYAVEHGISDLIGGSVNVDDLAELLGRTFAEFKEIEPAPTEGWPTFAARRITTEP